MKSARAEFEERYENFWAAGARWLLYTTGKATGHTWIVRWVHSFDPPADSSSNGDPVRLLASWGPSCWYFGSIAEAFRFVPVELKFREALPTEAPLVGVWTQGVDSHRA